MRLTQILWLTVLVAQVTFTTSWAQNTMDSLYRLANAATVDSVKADLLHQLASESWDYNFNQGLDWARQSYEVALKARYVKGISLALTDIGLYHYFKGEYDESMNYYNQASIMGEGRPGSYLATVYLRQGNVYREQSRFDSARLLYKKATKWINRSRPSRALAFLHHNLGWLNFRLTHLDSAKFHFQKALSIRKVLGDSLFIAESWKSLGAVASALNEIDSAQWYFRQVKRIAGRYHNPELLIFYDIHQGELYFQKGEFLQATKLFTQALDSLAKHDYRRYRALVMKNIGQIFEWQGNYENALRYFYDALRMEELMGNKQEMARTYDMMGWAFVNQSDFTKASEIAQRSRRLFAEAGDAFGISDYYTLSGHIAFKQGSFPKARKFYDSALVVRSTYHSPILTVNVLNFIAEVLIAQKLYSEAMIYENQALAIYESMGNRNRIATYYNNMSSIMMAKNSYGAAEKYAKQAVEEAMAVKSISELRKGYANLSDIHTAWGDYRTAMHYVQKYVRISDSLLIAERTSKQAQYTALYDLENREKEIEHLNQRNILQQTTLDAQQSRLRFQNTVLVLAVLTSALLALLAFTLYNYYKNKSKSNEELSRLNREVIEQKEEIQAQSEELVEANQALIQLNHDLVEKSDEIAMQSDELRQTNQMITEINRDLDEIVTKRTTQLQEAYKELDTFFYRSSHDFRRPLTTFMGLAEVASVTVKDKNALDLFDKVKETARSLDKMLIKLQSISDVGAQQLVFKEVLAGEIFDNVCENFREEIQRKGIKIFREVTLHDKFISYPAMVKIIIENLLENAVQFSIIENPIIRFSVSQVENSVLMVMEDNGQGISKEYESKVFEMYFRASERSKGNGLGLYIVKKAVDKLKGTVRVETNYGIGSRFIIVLPMHESESSWTEF